MASKIKYNYIKDFDFCDRNHFMILKGLSIFAALAAIFCDRFLGTDLSVAVHFAAAVFLLCSGYGVAKSFQRKSGLQHYWENKILRVWIPSVVVLVAYSWYLTKNPVAWVANSPLGLMDNWLYLIMGGYAAFWLAFQFLEKQSARLIFLMACAALAFAVLPKEMNIRAHVFTFPVGVILAQAGWRRGILCAGWKERSLWLVISAAVGVIGAVLGSLLQIPYVQTLCWSLCFLGGAVSLTLSTYYLHRIPVFGVFAPLGEISYALYLLHGIFLSLIAAQQDWRVRIALAIVMIVAAGGFAWLQTMLLKWNRKVRRRGKAQLKGNMYR